MSKVRVALLAAIVTMVAVLGTVGTLVLIDPEVGPVVLGVMLVLSLARRTVDQSRHERVEAAIALPLVGLAAAGVGVLFVVAPIAAAVLYTVAMFVSIWIRRFGTAPARVGTLIALPFVALLVAPAPLPENFTGVVRALYPAFVAVVAVVWVVAVRMLARAVRILPPTPIAPASSAAHPTRVSSLRPRPTTRLAIQFGTSIALSFVVGFLLFQQHWTWVVVTAVVVAVGNRGRADVVFKGVNRFAGAAIGTVIAFALPAIQRVEVSPAVAGTALLVVVFLALFTRAFGYIWWALFITLGLAVLQLWTGTNAPSLLLEQRLAEIVVGTVIAFLVAWFLLPVRSESTIRSRLSPVLAQLNGADPPEFAAALASFDQVAAPYDALHRVAPRARRPRALGWVRTTRSCLALADGGVSESALRAAGRARQALREPDELQGALDRLQRTLAGGDEPDPGGRE